MSGTHHLKKPVTSAVKAATASGDSPASVPSRTKADAENAGLTAKHKSVEAADSAGGHDVESTADVGQGGNVETGSSAPRESLESMPASDSGDVERM